MKLYIVLEETNKNSTSNSQKTDTAFPPQITMKEDKDNYKETKSTAAEEVGH
jgi:hypothetical protein